VKTILFGIVALFILSLSVQAGSEPESEEAIAARNVWHAAKLRGVAFRAIGQEPGWLLEMTPGEKILLVTNTGQTRTEYPMLSPRFFRINANPFFQSSRMNSK
jgi:hypothetical protein